MSSDSFFWGWRSRRLTLLIVLTAFALCAAGCSERSSADRALAIGMSMSYFQDPKTGLCFAWYEGYPNTISSVGCIPEVIRLIPRSANAVNPQPTNDAQQSAKPKGANQ